LTHSRITSAHKRDSRLRFESPISWSFQTPAIVIPMRRITNPTISQPKTASSDIAGLPGFGILDRAHSFDETLQDSATIRHYMTVPVQSLLSWRILKPDVGFHQNTPKTKPRTKKRAFISDIAIPTYIGSGLPARLWSVARLCSASWSFRLADTGHARHGSLVIRDSPTVRHTWL
jgi:hypothetical protein